MDKDFINIKIWIIILDLLKIMNLMAKVLFINQVYMFLKMDLDLKVFLKIQKNKALAVYNIKMEIYIKVNFIMIKNMVKELKFIKIKLNMLVYIIKIKKMEMENLLINLEILMKANSEMV